MPSGCPRSLGSKGREGASTARATESPAIWAVSRALALSTPTTMEMPTLALAHSKCSMPRFPQDDWKEPRNSQSFSYSTGHCEPWEEPTAATDVPGPCKHLSGSILKDQCSWNTLENLTKPVKDALTCPWTPPQPWKPDLCFPQPCSSQGLESLLSAEVATVTLPTHACWESGLQDPRSRVPRLLPATCPRKVMSCGSPASASAFRNVALEIPRPDLPPCHVWDSAHLDALPWVQGPDPLLEKYPGFWEVW
uniref:uncharacterized protein LOC120892875 n=1 Tax=Ictidomys tridecemlineatus TaxID=43179 RepID=UPI001A9CF3B0|nr:uncharacterized protein LOC120892875 [Ictidomys tridecemlineatus]